MLFSKVIIEGRAQKKTFPLHMPTTRFRESIVLDFRAKVETLPMTKKSIPLRIDPTHKPIYPFLSINRHKFPKESTAGKINSDFYVEISNVHRISSTLYYPPRGYILIPIPKFITRWLYHNMQYAYETLTSLHLWCTTTMTSRTFSWSEEKFSSFMSPLGKVPTNCGVSACQLLFFLDKVNSK